jgi:glycosyltransferase 2 family protein
MIHVPPLLRHPLVTMAVRLGGTLIGLAIVGHNLDGAPLRKTLLATNGWYVLGALGCFIGSKLLSAQRLNHFLAADGLWLSPGLGRQLYWLGMFYNLLLPGGIGGDGYKAFYLHQRSGLGLSILLKSLLADRLTGLLGLLVLILINLTLWWGEPWQRWLIVLATVGVMVGAREIVGRFFSSYRLIWNRVVGESLAVQGLQCVSLWLIGQGLSVSGSPFLYNFLFLLSSVLATLPITIGGAGIRELTFLSGAAYLQLPVADAVGSSVLFYALTVLVSCSGVYYTWVPPCGHPVTTGRNKSSIICAPGSNTT